MTQIETDSLIAYYEANADKKVIKNNNFMDITLLTRKTATCLLLNFIQKHKVSMDELMIATMKKGYCWVSLSKTQTTKLFLQIKVMLDIEDQTDIDELKLDMVKQKSDAEDSVAGSPTSTSSRSLACRAHRDQLLISRNCQEGEEHVGGDEDDAELWVKLQTNRVCQRVSAVGKCYPLPVQLCKGNVHWAPRAPRAPRASRSRRDQEHQEDDDAAHRHEIAGRTAWLPGMTATGMAAYAGTPPIGILCCVLPLFERGPGT